MLNNGNTQQRLENGPSAVLTVRKAFSHRFEALNDSNPITLTFPGPGEYEVSLAIQNFCGTEDTTIVIVVNDAVDTVCIMW